ncbi:MAG: SDR family oxidoreductase [Candidatus Promineifilaceae bacterium]
MKVLFIGGTGIISSACTNLALDKGIDLYLLNRGQSERHVPDGARVLLGDIRDPSVAEALSGHTFDVVVNWIAFTPEHIETDLALFAGRTAQYIFISSASAYHKPVRSLPITESTPLYNPYWAYSRAKIACEERLLRAYREDGFPMTIVRPSHTYDRTLLPMSGGYTVVERMRRGLPVIVHGDGTSLWVLTHHRDFAKGFVGLLGNPAALGEAVQITSDEVLTWNAIFELVGRAAGVEPQLVHIPSNFIAAFDAGWGSSLLGDKAHSVIFDNSKIKRLVPGYQATIPFHRGVEEIMAYYDADPTRHVFNDSHNQLVEQILAAYGRAWPA